MILNVHHAQDNTERILALQVLDSRVNVLGMEAMILQAQEEGTRRHPEDIIGWYIAVFPGQRLDLFQERIALLSWRDNDGGWAGSSGQCLRLWLLHSRFGSRRGGTLSVHALLLSDRCYMLMWKWMLTRARGRGRGMRCVQGSGGGSGSRHGRSRPTRPVIFDLIRHVQVCCFRFWSWCCGSMHSRCGPAVEW